MADYTLRLNVEQFTIDSEDAESNVKDFFISEDFTIEKTETYLISSAQLWVPVHFGNIQTAELIKLKADESISVRFNGGAEISSVEDIIIRGEFTSFDIKNNSGSQSEVKVELYG